MSYGKELIIDLYGCDVGTFNRESITEWLVQLCELIDMDREDLHFWDYEGCPEEKAAAPVHLVGTSAVQFITTSDIVIHTVDKLRECYVNIFSCKHFECVKAEKFTRDWFKASRSQFTIVMRGKDSRA